MVEQRVAGDSDQKLVTRILKGEKDAFEMIMERYQRPIINFTYRMTHDREIALDLAQEVFIKAYNSLNSYNSGYKLSTWLYKIASNHVIDYLRKKEPRWVSIDTSAEEDGRPMDLPAIQENQVDSLVFSEKLEKIQTAIKRLPLSYRRLITLRHVNECSYEEIAAICSLPLGTVKNRIFRAREMLRAELDGIL